MTAAVSGMVSAFQRYSIDDGPGIRTTVFLKGCQLRCPWCHNPETIDYYPEIYFRFAKCIGCGQCAIVCPVDSAIDLHWQERINRQLCIRCMKCTEICPSGALETVGRMMTVSEVMEEVMKDILFYESSGGGVTFSGGEPTTQAEFLEALLKQAKSLGLHTCIETNGYAGSEVWKKLLPYLDLVLMDIKHMDSDQHEKVVGAPNRVILNSARQLAPHVELILRTPLIPGFNDSEAFIEQAGQFAASLPNVKQYDLIPYHDYGSSKYIMLGKEENLFKAQGSLEDKLPRYKEILESYGLEVRILK